MYIWYIRYSHTHSKSVAIIKSDTFYVIHYIIWYYIILHYITLYYIILHYITLYYIIHLIHTLHSRTHCSICGTHVSYLMHTIHRCAHTWWNKFVCLYMYVHVYVIATCIYIYCSAGQYLVHMYHIWCIRYTDAHKYDGIRLFMCTCIYDIHTHLYILQRGSIFGYGWRG